MEQSRNLVAMKDPEFFKTLEQHRPNWQTSDYFNRWLTAVDADLRRWSFESADLSCAELPGCDFSGCDMRGASLGGGNFASARFASSDLTRACLGKGNFDYTNFTDAKLHGVQAVRATFIGATLFRAQFTEADLLRVLFDRADLRGACLLRCDLKQASLDGTKVRGIHLSGSTAVETVFCNDIDIGTDETSEILTGSAAREWLIRAAEGAQD